MVTIPLCWSIVDAPFGVAGALVCSAVGASAETDTSESVGR